MTQIILEIPNEPLLALKLPVEEVGKTLQLVAAIKLYEMGQISSGVAAQLAGIPRPVFLSKLADYGVNTFQLTEEQLQRETRFA